MAKDDQRDKQKTPKGYEIPVPKREAVLRDLMKVAPPVKPPAKPDEDSDSGAE